MEIFINALVKNIGYPLASKLVGMLKVSIQEHYKEEMSRDLDRREIETYEEEKALYLSVSRAISREERNALARIINDRNKLLRDS